MKLPDKEVKNSKIQLNMLTKFKFALLSIFAALISLSISSCKTAKDESQGMNAKVNEAISKTNSYQALDNSLLWKITGNGIEKPSYLFGTIHMIGGEDFFLPDGTMSAMDESENVVFEIDITQMSDMSNVMGLMSKAFMKDNLTIKDLVSADDYVLIEDRFEKMGLPLMMFQRMKPMFLTVFASGDMSPGDLQSGKIKSYEFEFMEMAENSDKPISGLETLEFQLSVFDSIPYKAQADMLMEALKAGDTGSDSFQEIVEVYKKQNLEEMLAMTMSEEGGLSEYDDLLLTQRNKNWIPQMKTMMSDQQNFFAVGAGHLAGETGVVHLLRLEGYSVEPYNGK